MQINNDFKKKIIDALLEARENYTGSDKAFASQWKINNAIYSRLKNGELSDGFLSASQWLEMGRLLNVNPNEQKWNTADTEVFRIMKRDIEFCQEYSAAKLFVDECDLGKSHNAKYFKRNLKNCFYVDCSQSKTKKAFTLNLAQKIGVDTSGTYAEIKDRIKYNLKVLHRPIVILDEAGDLEYGAFLDIKEYWNATEGACGWYMMGADGMRKKMEKGMNSRKVGYNEIFSRFSAKYTTIVPQDRQEKYAFYRQLVTDVVSANIPDQSKVNEVVRLCMVQESGVQFAGLRRAKKILEKMWRMEQIAA